VQEPTDPVSRMLIILILMAEDGLDKAKG